MPQHVAALAAGAAGMIHPHHFALIETAFSNAAGLRQLAGLHHQGQQQQQLQDHHGHSISSQGGLQDTSPTIQSPPLQQQHQVKYILVLLLSGFFGSDKQPLAENLS